MDSALPHDRLIQLKNLTVVNSLKLQLPVSHKSSRDIQNIAGSSNNLPINLKNIIIKRFLFGPRNNYAMAYFDEKCQEIIAESNMPIFSPLDN